MTARTWMGALAALALSGVAVAQKLPTELEGWQAWVLDGEAARTCTLRAGASGKALSDFSCVAAGTLDLMPAGEGLAFEVRIKTDQDTFVDLPGQDGRWPSQVTLDGQDADLRWNGQRWQVHVKSGEHTLRGAWKHGFDQVAMPGLFAQARWAPEDRPLRHENGQTWVRAKVAVVEQVEDDTPAQPQVRVWRLLADGQALTLETRVDVRLSGGVERLDLGQVLPEGFEVTSWSGTVPTVVTPQGHLMVQAGRGRHTLTVMARCSSACVPNPAGALRALTPRKLAAPWPDRETWSVQGNPIVRTLGIEGAGVDPAQAQVPDEWQSLPAYTVSPTAGLSARVVARGRVAGEGERLELVRESWWREDNWLHWDHVLGTLPVGGRLGLDKPYVLGRMERHGQLLPLSVDGKGQVGVEWSAGQVDAWAQSTQPFGRAARTGWSGTVESMSQTLHLPPGAALVSAPGAQHGHGGWSDRFNLLTFFGIAIFSLLVRQALGLRSAVVAGALAAGWVGSGGALWLFWLLACATTLLLVGQALPQGRLVKFLRLGALGLMALLALYFIPFAGNQARQILHPQLAQGEHFSTATAMREMSAPAGAEGGMNAADMASMERGQAKMAAEVMPMAPPAPPPPPMVAQRMAPVMSAPDLDNAVDGNDPLAGIGLAQVGEALPTWQQAGLGRAYHLRYPGPITIEDGNVSQPWIAGPWMVRFLRLLGTLGLAWLALRLLAKMVPGEWRARLPEPAHRWAAKLGLALLLVPGLALASSPAPAVEADQVRGPDASLLESLRERLTRAPVCAPQCASLVGAQLVAQGEQLVMTYRVAAQHSSGWVLPEVTGAELVDVQVDGSQGWWLDPGTVRLDKGQARVVARYRPTTDRVRVNFVQAPLASDLTLAGWSGSGDQESGSWTIERANKVEVKDTPKDALPGGASVAGFVSVLRQLHLGGTAEATTTVSRAAGSDGALTVLVPAITGEAVEGERVERKGEAWEVILPAGQTQLSWTSRITIPKDGKLTLKPLEATLGTETWQFSKSPAWTLGLEGIPEGQPSGNGTRVVLPLSGETLTVLAARLPAAPGNAQRIDHVSLETQAGPKLATHTLAWAVVAAQAGERKLGLPAGAQVMSITANGQPLSLPVANNALLIPVERGTTQLQVQFRSESGQAWLSTPAVDLHGSASNVRQRIGHDEGRWILATWGQGWGTAVLYWSQLLVLLAVAYGLARLPGQLFTLPSAVLLVLGFSTLPGTVFWLGALVAWVAWVAWRARMDTTAIERNRFNLGQLALAGFTGLVVLAVVIVIGYGLLGARPDMMLRAPAGLSQLEWWRDAAPVGPLAGPTVVSLPMWVYQLLLFGWALWFAGWLVAAVKRALAAWTQGGYWRDRKDEVPPLPPQEVGA